MIIEATSSKKNRKKKDHSSVKSVKKELAKKRLAKKVRKIFLQGMTKTIARFTRSN
jgi:hypothetical protein